MKLNSILRRWRLFLLAALALHGFYTSLQRRMTIDFWRRARSVKASISDCEKVRNITLTESLKSLEPDEFRRLVNDLGHCPWQYNESEHNKLRLELQNCCNARSMLLTTKQNAPLGTSLNYETNPNRNITVTEEIYRMLPKEPPFLKKPFETCAVVGNGGILLNSFCGEQIDSMDYIFRLNLPPLTMAEHIGVKSHFITCNPSILRQKYERLFSRRKPFIDHIKGYGPAMIVLPAFAYVSSTEVSFRVFYSVEEFQLKNKVVYYHPDYLSNISSYWKEMGVEARRLSSGVMIVTAALELCKKVTLYGFWPFSRDPEGNVILHHYYDNNIPKPGFHAMPHEFFIYTKMHSKGALYLQVGKC